jgi:uncharacterized membrane protein
MSQEKSAAFCRGLYQEVPIWVESGLVDQNIAGKLLSLYPIPESKSKFVGLLTIFGSVLMGLGVLLFVGSNWEHLTSLAKLAIIIAAIGVSNLSGVHFSNNEHPRLGQSLYLLGGLIYGAGIWLVAQIYQLDLDWALGLSLWSIGLIPMALLVRSIPLTILNSIVMLLWTFSQHSVFVGIAVFGLLVAFSYAMRSRMSLVLTLLQGPLLGIHGGSDGVASSLSMLMWAATMFSWYLYHKEKGSIFTGSYLYVSLLIGLPVLLCVTNSDFWTGQPISSTILLHTAFAVLSAVYVGMKTKKFIPEISVYMIATFLMAAITVNTAAKTPIILVAANAIFFSTVIALIYFGARRLESTAMVNIGVVFFAIGIFVRYIDTFFKMLDKSIFFLLGGLVLLVGGYLLEKQRRSLVRGIAQ